MREASLSGVTDSSHVIARGVIDSVWTSQYPAGEGRVGRMQHWRLRVVEWLKGEATGSSIEFVVPTIEATFVPKWYRDVPRGIGKGTEWLVFLKTGERGFYPFGGPNSLLQIEGQELIYDNKVRYPLNLREATRAIRSAVTHVRD
jgi:hypothetical protein